MEDPQIVHVLQPASDSQGLIASKVKIIEIAVGWVTNQLQPICFRVLVKVFSEAEVAGAVEHQSERVSRGGINSDNRDNVRMGELSGHPHLPEVCLERDVNHVVSEDICVSLVKYVQCRRIRSTCRTFGGRYGRRGFLPRCLQNLRR
jgi:hypothetical protein